MKKIAAILLISFLACAAFAAIDETYYKTNNSHKTTVDGCMDCHGSKNPVVAPDIDKRSNGCISCHGTLVDLAKTTAQVKPNPHDSHIGKTDCYECHNVHKPPVNMCGECHTFQLNVR